MTSLLLACLPLALVLVPGAVFCLAARRLFLSRGPHAVLYHLAGAFAFAGAAGAAWPGPGGAVDAGGTALALASLPLWLAVRAVTARGRRAPSLLKGPIFASVRRAGLHAGPPRLTRGA
jgi:hypothetical protein